MTLQEFHEYLKTQDIEDKIVYMRYKYSWENEWTYTNEILEVDISDDEYYIWLKDWDEGQDEVEILGCISVSDIDVPEFEKLSSTKKDGDKMIITEWILDTSNSEKERLIKTVDNKRKRDIIFNRIINGMTYQSILLKYYPEYEYKSEVSKLKECRKIRKIVDRFIMKQVNLTRK